MLQMSFWSFCCGQGLLGCTLQGFYQDPEARVVPSDALVFMLLRFPRHKACDGQQRRSGRFPKGDKLAPLPDLPSAAEYRQPSTLNPKP